MTAGNLPDQAQIEALSGHRFPGGSYRIAHWENVLLTGCTGAEPAPGGLARHTINQGPLGLGYLVNMLQDWAGDGCIRRIKIIFPQVVLDGDRVIARGRITALHDERGVQLADCDIWLEHGERGVLRSSGDSLLNSKL